MLFTSASLTALAEDLSKYRDFQFGADLPTVAQLIDAGPTRAKAIHSRPALNGIFIPESAKEKPQEGEAMAVGHGKMLESGQLMALDVKVGDRVLFGKCSGTEMKLIGTE